MVTAGAPCAQRGRGTAHATRDSAHNRFARTAEDTSRMRRPRAYSLVQDGASRAHDAGEVSPVRFLFRLVITPPRGTHRARGLIEPSTGSYGEGSAASRVGR